MARLTYASRARRRLSSWVARPRYASGSSALKHEVLELPLELPDAQPLGQRRVDLGGLARDALLLLDGQGTQGAHVVQPVGELDEHHADVFGHGQEHLADVLRLLLLVGSGAELGQLGDAVDEAARPPPRNAPRRRAMEYSVSSGTSWSRAAWTASGSRPSSDRIWATASGCVMYGSPDARRCGPCASTREPVRLADLGQVGIRESLAQVRLDALLGGVERAQRREGRGDPRDRVLPARSVRPGGPYVDGHAEPSVPSRLRGSLTDPLTPLPVATAGPTWSRRVAGGTAVERVRRRGTPALAPAAAASPSPAATSPSPRPAGGASPCPASSVSPAPSACRRPRPARGPSTSPRSPSTRRCPSMTLRPRRLQKVLDTARARIPTPGISVAIRLADGRTWLGVSGDRQLSPARPVDEDTVFSIASITKTFVTAVVMQLVAEGRIGLDDPLSRYLPDYPRATQHHHPPAAGAHQRRRQLLRVTGLQPRGLLRPDAALEGAATSWRSWASRTASPGRCFHYSNTNFVLLGKVVEQVTGQHIARTIRRAAAGPTGPRRHRLPA